MKEGLIASRIAAHAGDIVKLGEKASRRDREMSLARADLDWESMFKLSFDQGKVKKAYQQFGVKVESCDMCGPYCVFLVLDKYLRKKRKQ